ncbi:MAG: hypothetical protein HOP10_12100 [Chitinophagaceae bacterium]|nr:hypothetical protein [Chitinophagaceae bacterium]
MKTKLFLLLLITGSILINSCYYDKEDLLYGNSKAPCADTTSNISYNQYVVPLLRQYCYSCHTGSFPSGGIVMGSYATDKAIGQNGKLYGSINYSPGYSPMPKGMARFTTCQVANIKKWIDAGMPNN